MANAKLAEDVLLKHTEGDAEESDESEIAEGDGVGDTEKLNRSGVQTLGRSGQMSTQMQQIQQQMHMQPKPNSPSITADSRAAQFAAQQQSLAVAAAAQGIVQNQWIQYHQALQKQQQQQLTNPQAHAAAIQAQLMASAATPTAGVTSTLNQNTSLVTPNNSSSTQSDEVKAAGQQQLSIAPRPSSGSEDKLSDAAKMAAASNFSLDSRYQMLYERDLRWKEVLRKFLHLSTRVVFSLTTFCRCSFEPAGSKV